MADIQIVKPNVRVLELPVIGTTPLIVNKFSEKAKQEMLDKQMKKAKKPKEAKDPEQCFKDSLHVARSGKYGFPAVGFKAAAVRAAKMMDGLTMIDAQQMFFVLADEDDLVLIDGDPTIRDDTVRLPNRSTDIRFRGEFRDWSCTLRIEYNESLLSAEQLVNLFQTAGFSVGVGEWRPVRGGQYGRFAIDTDKIEKAKPKRRKAA